MLGRILSSNWVAIPILVIAASGVVLLYLRGRTLEAGISAGLLVVALILIGWGGGQPPSRGVRD
jgi:hypothetical protein